MSAKHVRNEGLDKFYTLPTVANHCINAIGQKYDWNQWDLVIEPSAGNGSFLTQIPLPESKVIGLDICPEHPTIQTQDFFKYTPLPKYRNVAVIGNPPFGRVSSLAIKFFNHAAVWANVIAFIVPRTFRRISVQNRLDVNFQLMHDEDIPQSPCAFTPPMNVKCCLQIWQRSPTQRTRIELPTQHTDWTFLGFGPNDQNHQPTPPPNADFAIRAYGGKCGVIITNPDELVQLRPKSWHWIKVNSTIDKKTLIDRFHSLNYIQSVNTARQNSIGRGELVQLYREAYESDS